MMLKMPAQHTQSKLPQLLLGNLLISLLLDPGTSVGTVLGHMSSLFSVSPHTVFSMFPRFMLVPLSVLSSQLLQYNGEEKTNF